MNFFEAAQFLENNHHNNDNYNDGDDDAILPSIMEVSSSDSSVATSYNSVSDHGSQDDGSIKSKSSSLEKTMPTETTTATTETATAETATADDPAVKLAKAVGMGALMLVGHQALHHAGNLLSGNDVTPVDEDDAAAATTLAHHGATTTAAAPPPTAGPPPPNLYVCSFLRSFVPILAPCWHDSHCFVFYWSSYPGLYNYRIPHSTRAFFLLPQRKR